MWLTPPLLHVIREQKLRAQALQQSPEFTSKILSPEHTSSMSAGCSLPTSYWKALFWLCSASSGLVSQGYSRRWGVGG